MNETLKQLETLGPIGIKLRTKMQDRFDLHNNTDAKVKPGVVRMIVHSHMDFNILIQLSYSMVATGTSEGQKYVQLAIAIGERVRNYYNLPIKNELSLRLGKFILNAYAELFMIAIKLVNGYDKGKSKKMYKIYMGKNRYELRKLVKEFNEVSDPYKPLFEKAPNWEFGSVVNPNKEKIKLIKHAKVGTLQKINKFNTPIVLNSINKKQNIAYYVNPEVFNIYRWALQTNQNVFEHNSVKTITKERAEAKKREALQVLAAAVPYVGKKFYQQYQADNRGRLYPLSAYLNELNSDNAKGMLSFYYGKPLGKNGKEELFHHIANMYGEDKLSHKDKVKFVEDNYYVFVNYGLKPKEAIGWMQAEEPFQFLSAVIELAKMDKHFVNTGTVEDYICHTISYRDGANNGLQHLISLAKDDIHAHLVNVKNSPDGKPGDMYTYVANIVKDIISHKAKQEGQLNKDYYNLYFKSIEKIRNRWREADNNNDKTAERKKKLIKWYQKRYKTQLALTDITYWDKAKLTNKIWRKLLKRNVMTWGYSATKNGFADQIIQDSRDIDNEYLSNKQHSAARVLGSLVYETIESEFPEVASVMKLFKDNCLAYMKKNKDHIKYNTVLTNFPFSQYYVKYKDTRVKTTDGLFVTEGKDAKWVDEVSFTIKSELAEINTGKSQLAISPNAVHNLDSCHLMLVIDACDFDIVSAHDSYGAHCCDVPEMNKVIREKFKEIIDANPLQHILNETGNLVPMIKQGNLQSNEILDSEFAFS